MPTWAHASSTAEAAIGLHPAGCRQRRAAIVLYLNGTAVPSKLVDATAALGRTATLRVVVTASGALPLIVIKPV